MSPPPDWMKFAGSPRSAPTNASRHSAKVERLAEGAAADCWPAGSLTSRVKMRTSQGKLSLLS